MSERPAPPPPDERRHTGIEALHAAHSGRVQWVVRQILGDGPDAEDCVQEVWIRVQERLDQLQDPEKAGAWIGTVARNRALEMLRGAARHRKALRAALEIARYEEALRGTPEELDRRTPLLAAVGELSPEERRLVELRLEDESRSLGELATLVDAPRHRVKYLWKKVRETLRAKIVEWGTCESYLGEEPGA